MQSLQYRHGPLDYRANLNGSYPLGGLSTGGSSTLPSLVGSSAFLTDTREDMGTESLLCAQTESRSRWQKGYSCLDRHRGWQGPQRIQPPEARVTERLHVPGAAGLVIPGYQSELGAAGRRCKGQGSKRGGEITSCVMFRTFREKGRIREVGEQCTEAN